MGGAVCISHYILVGGQLSGTNFFVFCDDVLEQLGVDLVVISLLL
jgi:hypothetical protein